MASETTLPLSVETPSTRSAVGATRAAWSSNHSGDAGGAPAARRLARELESLEASLLAAERAALACRPTFSEPAPDPNSDVASRRAELDRRELELQERERTLERQRALLEQSHERLVRAKDSVKRAIFKFRSQAAERTDELDGRERRLAAAHSELLEGRREFAREQIRWKAALRESIQNPHDFPSVISSPSS
jgi:DNA repair exonuclease SbcCD ATPase subunit